MSILFIIQFVIASASFAQEETQPPKSIEEYTKEATALINDKKMNEALQIASELMKQYPDSPDGLTMAAYIQAKAGNPVKAKEFLQELLWKNPDFAPAHFLLGSLYYSQNCITQAILAFQRYLILQPQGANAQNAIGVVHRVLITKATRNEEGKIEIFFNLGGNCNDCDLESALVAAQMKSSFDSLLGTTPAKPISQFSQTYGEFFFNLPDAIKKNSSCFAANFYAPYFIELRKKGYTLPLIVHIYTVSNIEDFDEWFGKERNKKKIEEFIEWSRNYKFTKPS